MTFTGTIFDSDAAVIAQFTDSGLVHVEVILDTPDPLARAQHQRLLEVLTGKYGKPANIYPSAFVKGMNQGGMFRSTWPKRGPGQPKPDHKNVEQFERLDLYSLPGKGLHVVYVSASWPREALRREALKAKILE